MSVTDDTPRGARLALLPSAARALSPAARPPAPQERVRLTAWQRMEVEQARVLLLTASDLFATRPDAYVAGLIEGAAGNLLDILDAVTEA